MNAPWLDRLERKLDFLAIPGLASFLVGMNAAVAVLSLVKPEFPSQLVLDPILIGQGQIWRLVSFLFIPPETAGVWLFFWLVLFYLYAQALENIWGDFKFTVFCATGAAATSLAAFGLGTGLSNVPFNTSLFLAFARLNPEFEILIFFLFPVKMKWLAALVWILTTLSFLTGGLETRLAVLAGLANYILFFGPGHWRDLKFLIRRWRNRGRFS